jgi:hypothetical protein
MRRNQEQQTWNLGIFIKFLAIPAVLMTLIYLGRNAVAKDKSSDVV